MTGTITRPTLADVLNLPDLNSWHNFKAVVTTDAGHELDDLLIYRVAQAGNVLNVGRYVSIKDPMHLMQAHHIAVHSFDSMGNATMTIIYDLKSTGKLTKVEFSAEENGALKMNWQFEIRKVTVIPLGLA